MEKAFLNVNSSFLLNLIGLYDLLSNFILNQKNQSTNKFIQSCRELLTGYDISWSNFSRSWCFIFYLFYDDDERFYMRGS